MTAAETATAALARLAGAFEGTLAVAARDETTGETVDLESRRQMPTASVIKLAVLVTVFERARDGTISLDDRLAIRDEERVGGSGVIKELSAGTELTIRDLATLMVVVSDNMATNLLIDAAGGVEGVNRFVHDGLGLAAITLHRKLMFSGGRGPLALAAPHDLVALVGGLLAGRRHGGHGARLQQDVGLPQRRPGSVGQAAAADEQRLGAAHAGDPASPSGAAAVCSRLHGAAG